MTFPCEKYGRIHLGVNCLDCALVEQAEQRVREEVNAEWWGKSPYQQGYHRGYDIGYEAGRDAALTLAREAVAALEGRYDWPAVYGPDALAAIDALRGESDV